MLLSFKTKSDSWIIETNLQAVSCWRQHETLAYCRPTCWSFCVGLNENANSFFATRCRFWSSKNSGFPGNVVHKAALRSQTLLYQAWNKNRRPIGPITADKHQAKEWYGKWIVKWIVFGSRWANKVQINAYYKKIKVFFVGMHDISATISVSADKWQFFLLSFIPVLSR